MRAAPGNPKNNIIGHGLTDGQIEEAVRRSGYPLQTLIAQSLGRAFYVREEWSFVDAETQELRSLDILAEKGLFDVNANLRVRPIPDLIIECKQGDLPYVFFLASNRTWMSKFPTLAGLFRDRTTAITDDDNSTWTTTIQQALGIDKDPFVREGPRHCISFAKCLRKGKDLEISGTDTFNGVALPLVKAVQHFQKQEAPPSTAYYHDMHMAVLVAVIDAPMIAVEVPYSGQNLVYEPWLRVIRNQAMPYAEHLDRTQIYAVDIVHKDFFLSYISDHVVPFTERVSQVALKHEVEVATGEAFVSKLGKRSFDAFSEMRPRAKVTRQT